MSSTHAAPARRAPTAADVSVVIPTYDRADLLPEAIDSVLAQAEPPGEVVVVDDGSTDATPEVLARYGSRIRLIRQENRGESAARNRGVEEATGAWIAFLDSDDAWLPGALDAFLAGARRYPDADLLALRARRLAPDGSIGRRAIGKRSPGPDFTTSSLLGEDAGGVLTPMVRRSVLLEAGGFDESFRSAEDCELWLRLSRTSRMVGLDAPLLLLRTHAGNISADRELNARMWLRILDKLRREDPGFVAKHRRLVRRAVAKEHRRLGRELLRKVGEDPERLGAARSELAASLRASPVSPRTWRWLAAAWLAPRRAGPRARG